MAEGKISPALQEKLTATPAGQPLVVIVQLNPPAISKSDSAQGQMSDVRGAFDRAVAELSQRLALPKDSISETAWINSTARCALTADQIGLLDTDPAVVSIDLPATLQFG